MYLSDLSKAYRAINRTYLKRQVIHSLLRNVDVKPQEIERVFLAELYHQWRTIMDNNKTSYQTLVLHSEIGKMVTYGTVQHPDLALHGGQIGAYRRTHNKVFVELKMKDIDDEDIIKCFNAMSNLNYCYGVYILHYQTKISILCYLLSNTHLFSGKTQYYSRFYFLTSVDGLISLRELLTNFPRWR
jgi:hypothetical protein